MDAVALLSGGLDSGTAAALAEEAGTRIALALFADYGQRAASSEGSRARSLAARRGWPWEEIALPWLAALAGRAGSALVGAAELPERTAADPGDAATAAAVWVPARNVVLVAAAAAAADALGASAVVCGFNREEASTFPDNSPAFAAACDGVLALGTRLGVRVVSPTLDLDKAGIAREARRLGFGPDDFWSCYRGGERPCGRCESCARSERAWRGPG